MVTQNNLFQQSLTQEKARSSLIVYSLFALMLIIAVMTTSFYLLYENIASSQQGIVYNELEKKAVLLSTVIDIVAYEKLLASKEKDGGKNYLKILAPLRKAHFSIAGVRYVYTAQTQNVNGEKKIFFGLDTSLKLDSDKDGIIDHSEFRSEYAEAPAEITHAIETKQIAFTRDPYTDKYGTFISAFVPLINSKGTVIGVLGVDMLYSNYLAIQQVYKKMIIKVYSIFLGLVLLFSIILWYFYRKLSQSKIQEISLENEIKDQQNFFIQEAKMSDIGKMVAGITHEINNPLTIIKVLSEQGIKRLGRNQMDIDSHRKNYQDIKNSSERIMEVIKNMKSIVSRPIGTSDAYSFSLFESLNNVMTAIKYKSEVENVNIHVEIDKTLLIHGNRSQLEQVFFNLISNSIDAIASQQKAWVRVYCEHDESYAYIHFIDCGTGMDDELYKKIEQGFYTSKANGSGMGLMICKKIISIHKGEFHLKKDLNTHFVVKLPLYEMNAAEDVPA